MIKTEFTLPELGSLLGPRGMPGAGLGLLLAHQPSDDRRKGIGWTLPSVGVLSPIPLAMMVFGNKNRRDRA